MKKLLFACCALVLLSVSAVADNYKYELSPYVGYNFADTDCVVDDAPGVGLNFNTYFDKNWGLRLAYERLLDADLKSVDESIDISRFYANGIYKKEKPWKSITPYVVAGGGYEAYEDSKKLPCAGQWFQDIGVGANVALTKRLRITPEVKVLRKDKCETIDVIPSIALTYAFGLPVEKSVDRIVYRDKIVTKEVPVERIVEKIVKVNVGEPICTTPISYADRCDNSYYVQVAATVHCEIDCNTKFRNQALLNKLRMLGYAYSFHTTTNASGHKVTRLLVGPYQCKKDANKELCDIKAQVKCDAFVYSKRR